MAERVLIVEDERHIARLIQVNLERQKYECVTVETGAAALFTVLQETFSMAIIDITLPDMSGHEVARQIRENPETSHIKIILLADKHDSDKDDPGGADMYLTEPFNPLRIVGM